MNKLEVGDFVLCTVDRIVGTEVFVKIEGYGEGGIVMSEIAPGRIRNIRDYVVPKKKIVCKVLRINSNGNIDLSFRRVTPKERKEVMEQESQKKSYLSILKSTAGADYEKLISKIEEETDIIAFFENAKSNPEKLEKLVGKDNSKKIIEILNTQKKKKSLLKKELHLTTTKPNGITLIKNILTLFKGINVKYVAAGRYRLEIESEDIKSADKKLRTILDTAEKEAKKAGVEFSIK